MIRGPENPPPQPPAAAQGATTAPSAGTPASTSGPVVSCVVATNILRLRVEPRLGAAETIAGLFAGTKLDAFARNEAGTWIRVRMRVGTQEGWVSAQPGLITCDGPLAGLPVSP